MTPGTISVSAVVPVFRDMARALTAANALASQADSIGALLEVLVVDDASGDGTADDLERHLPASARLIRLERNRGRSGARNAGAAQASGELLLFMDCDCLPADAGFIAAHLRRFDADVVASTGPVVGTGQGFWHDFQVRSSARRAALHARGIGCAGSTQNLMVRRDRFEAVGGFDEDYRAYGFEDRDLLIRLGQLGSIAWAQDAIVEHHDDLDLATVCRKMREAGAGGSRLFRERHPEPYRALGYARMDAHLHFGWRPLRPLLEFGVPPAVRLAQAMVDWTWIPFPVRTGIVRGLSGLSYLRGTVDVLKAEARLQANRHVERHTKQYGGWVMHGLVKLKRVPVFGPAWQAFLDTLKPILFGLASARALSAVEASASQPAQRIARAARAAVVVPRIERMREALLSDTRALDDGTAPDAVVFDVGKTIRDACEVSKPPHLARLLTALCREFRPQCAVELGTNIGISGAYIASGLPEGAKLTTFEVSANRLRIASDLHRKLGLNNVSYVRGLFQETLGIALEGLPPIEFAFIDGHHQYQPTLDYFQAIAARAAPGAVFVFDDIRWSSGMRQAWDELKVDPRFSAVIDFYYMGVCVLTGQEPSERFTSGVIRVF